MNAGKRGSWRFVLRQILVSLQGILSVSQSNQTNPGRPTMCANCGAIVGAGETQCAVCGVQTSAYPTAVAGERPPDRETLKFARAILNRSYKFTIAFLVVNLFIFLLMLESSDFSSTVLSEAFSGPVLEAYGAKLNLLINHPYNQWWRLIAPMFLHVNLIHLLINMYSLMMVGPFVEKLYGSAKFVVFWILTGIGGLVASYLTVRPELSTGPLSRFIFKSNDFPSAGASGALFGLVGVLFVFGIKFRHELPPGFKRAFGTGLLPIILINLFIGFLGSRFIDNAAHLGGLVSGAVLALGVDYERPGSKRRITNAWRVLQVMALLLVVVAFYKVARNFNRPLLENPAAEQQSTRLIFQNYRNAMLHLQERVVAVIHHNDLSGAAEATDQAFRTPAPDARAAQLRDKLLSLLVRIAEAAVNASPEQEPGRPPQLDQKLIQEYEEWKKEYDQWLSVAAETYDAAQ